MKKIIYVFIESITLSLQELRTNRLRSFLSLMGISIGIFCIVAVSTAVDSIKKNLDDGMNRLGNNFIMVQKWPWAFGDANYAWWKYWNRPAPTREEMELLKSEITTCANADITIGVNNISLKYNSTELQNMSATACTAAFSQMNDMEFLCGRFFNYNEEISGTPLVILGYKTAEELNQNVESLLNSDVQLNGKRVKVLGILKKAGNGMFSDVNDNSILIGYNFLKTIQSVTDRDVDANIKLVAKPNVSVEVLKDEITRSLRGVRKLRPTQEDNFALNEMSILKNGFNSMFSSINMGGFFIGLLSLLIGAFGIANIMFVSVRERTKQIGIKKALGARQFDILLEFLLESVILCLIGGILGISVVFMIVKSVNWFTDFKLFLSVNNILFGSSISIIIGLVAGFIPAYTAARLDPVKAIRMNS
jgi:putative ABC transport system permease protein